ncbi:MAG: deoxycytidine triphosphate deaminase [Actinomycetota bacterium]|nr:deoxycytidine triphosphate deaminase [Actinomycetota bacterium]
MAYSDEEIRSAIAAGNIVVRPFRPEAIKGASLDVRLGRWCYRIVGSHPSEGRGAVFNPFDKAVVAAYFRLDQAAPIAKLTERPGVPDSVRKELEQASGIPEDREIILLAPGERILGHTEEFVGIRDGVSEMRARSTWGRCGITVALCAGWGDPGYVNRWTMEIANNNPSWVPLLVGERIAQIVFHQTGPVAHHYGDGGKYQVGDDFNGLIRNWSPEQMLPRAYKDLQRRAGSSGPPLSKAVVA